ncbi:acyl-CoA dehydrogenase family protein [Sphingopyxis granuli]|uniref:acyl-CoA dehydrogenase family protein n=1 Tax=Sphingopyxis granuli TaxID=267128 RepID=UPI001F537ABE|nr:acyl-CoA dehydrogenase family protein [Sphingopyxis granuli]UNK81073.1 acyl-CoA dehydrogenase family protein [Sphingopyxis granuli]
MADIASLGFGRDIFQPEHDAFRESVRRFLQREVVPNVRQWEAEGFFPPELFRKAGAAGLLCSAMPTEYGGGGGDVLHHLVLQEEHAFVPEANLLEGGLLTDIAAFTIADFGTDEQKRTWLPLFATGECISEIAMSEPAAGSDFSAIRCQARRDGDDWVISGQKSWITNGPILTMALVIANTQSDSGKPTKSTFIVPMGLPGISRKPTELIARTCGGVGEIFFDDVRVPGSHLLGGETGNGMRAGLGLMRIGRIAMAARSIAASEVARDLTVEYTKDRQAFGKRIFDFQNTQFKLASAATEIAAGRAFVDSGMRQLVEGCLTAEHAAMVRLFCTEVEGRVMDECLQLHGGMGCSNEAIISKLYTLARMRRIYGGTNEIMRLIIGGAL